MLQKTYACWYTQLAYGEAVGKENLAVGVINRVLRQPCVVAHKPILATMKLCKSEQLAGFRAIIVAPNDAHWMTWKRNTDTKWCLMDSEVPPTTKLYSLTRVWNALKKAPSAVFIP